MKKNSIAMKKSSSRHRMTVRIEGKRTTYICRDCAYEAVDDPDNGGFVIVRKGDPYAWHIGRLHG